MNQMQIYLPCKNNKKHLWNSSSNKQKLQTKTILQINKFKENKNNIKQKQTEQQNKRKIVSKGKFAEKHQHHHLPSSSVAAKTNTSRC